MYHKGVCIMDNFTKGILDFFAETELNILKEYKNGNKEYQRLCDENIYNSIKMKDICQKLNNKDIRLLETWKNTVYRLADMEKDILYLQGYKDCIKLLQFINLI